MPFTIPPSSRVPGSTPGPDVDMDNVSTALTSTVGVNVLNSAYGGGADPTGATDSTAAIQAALNAAGAALVRVPAGTYKVSSDLTMSTAGQHLVGDGIGVTILQPATGGTFTHGMINITADSCRVRDMSFTGASGTITSNPAISAIQINGSFSTYIENIRGQYINGWLVDLEGTASSTHIWLTGVRAMNCAAAVKLSGSPGSGVTSGALMNNCSSAQCGVSTGTFANLDAFLIQDTSDITATNLGFSVGNATTGHAIHIHGACSAIFLSVLDIGGFPTPTAGSGQCGIMIDDDVLGKTTGVYVSHATFQNYDIGAYVKGPNAFGIHFTDCSFSSSQTHGARIDTTFANTATFDNCYFGVTGGSNGKGGGTSFSYTATNASPCVFTATGSAFTNGLAVQLGASGLPTGFSAATTYYVVSASGTSFSLAATQGGTAINSTSTGSGTLNVGPVYDLYWNTTTAGQIRHCTFNTAIVAVGTVGVQDSVAINSGNTSQVVYPVFTGTGAASGNWFTNTPTNLVKF